ncbi:MAG: tetratricopeptide repeat protein [Acidobacteria bacterium]|nr:MAG: tetratricopeptide repeat protein [Acidobacteriota bacterium]
MARKPTKPAVEPAPRPDKSTPSGPRPSYPPGLVVVLPDGLAVAADEVEVVFAALAAGEPDPEVLTGRLWRLVRRCQECGRHEGAAAYVEKILALAQDPAVRARCFLTMGQLCEQRGDFPAAVAAYSRALALLPRQDLDWYFLNNNLGYSLNQVGRHGEAEAFCRAAIAIDAGRYNAHKNLGLSLQGQGRYVEAARCLLEAARAQPDDLRALGHLEDLLARHEEIARGHPEILKVVQEFCDAVRTSRREPVM